MLNMHTVLLVPYSAVIVLSGSAAVLQRTKAYYFSKTGTTKATSIC